MRHVVFRLGDERCALPLSIVRAVVVPPDRYTRVPRAPAHVCGVMNLRGRVVTVLDLGGLLGRNERDEPAKNARILVVDRGRRDLGLRVTDVEGIEEVGELEDPRGQEDAGQPTLEATSGVAVLREQRVWVLDPDRVDGLVDAVFGG